MVKTFDDAAVRWLERVYRTPSIVASRLEVLAMLRLGRGERVIDLGCGPGFLLFELAAAVGREGQAVGVDLSGPALESAKLRCAEFDTVETQIADVATLPYPDRSFDAAASLQVYEYLSDVDAALVELRRVLKPGGRAAIMATDAKSLIWWSRDDQERMERVIAAYDRRCADPHLPRTLGPRLVRAGFALTHAVAMPIFETDYGPHTFGGNMVGYLKSYAPGQGIDPDDAEAWASDLRRQGKEGQWFFSLNRYIFGVRRS